MSAKQKKRPRAKIGLGEFGQVVVLARRPGGRLGVTEQPRRGGYRWPGKAVSREEPGDTCVASPSFLNIDFLI